VGEEGVRAVPDPDRRELDASPRYRSCRARLDAALAYLDLAPTLDLSTAGPGFLAEAVVGG
jgi:single-stranded-DNA-specific exonuclease